MDFDAVERVLCVFESEELEYAVVGAAAINLLGLARGTEDLDVFVAGRQRNSAGSRSDNGRPASVATSTDPRGRTSGWRATPSCS